MKLELDMFKEKAPVALLLVSGALFLIATAIVALNVGHLPASIILHFDAYHGIDLFGTVEDLWKLLGAMIFLALVNTFLGSESFSRARTLAYLLIGTNVLLSLLTVVALATIVYVN